MKVNQERSHRKKILGNGENVCKNGIFKNESSKIWLEQEVKDGLNSKHENRESEKV